MDNKDIALLGWTKEKADADDERQMRYKNRIRDWTIYDERVSGRTLRSIGEQFGLSGTRIHCIYRKLARRLAWWELKQRRGIELPWYIHPDTRKLPRQP